MEGVVSAVAERAGLSKVACLRLEIGRLSAVVPDALRFCFDLCAAGTVLEGARLEIVEIAGRARCESCGAELAIESFGDVCRCGGVDLRIIAGEELRVKNMELA